MNSQDRLEQIADLKIDIQLPQGEMDSSFAIRLASLIQRRDINLMYDNNSGEIVEVVEWQNKINDKVFFSRKKVDPVRLQAILEQHFHFYRNQLDKQTGNWEKVSASPPQRLLLFLSANDDFRSAIKQFAIIVEAPYIYAKNNNLKIAKKGYDEDCGVFTKTNAPDIYSMSVHEAKKWFDEMLYDFPFQSPQDKINTLSMFITPMLRGLYQQYGVRTPYYLIMANQQGTGKDCLHSLVTHIYAGRKIEEGPISTERGCNPEETQKRLMASAQAGHIFIHHGNNKGHINDATIEFALTSATIGGRVLGTAKDAVYEHVQEYSGTGNLGITYTRDFARRMLPITLFCPDEDTTKRTFRYPDIEGWVNAHRADFLSAIYSFIKAWWDAGRPEGKGVFNSYPIWTKFISGIMTYNALGDPCATVTVDAKNKIGGDSETTDIVTFNQRLGEYLYNEDHSTDEYVIANKKTGLLRKDIYSLYQVVFDEMDDKPFAHFNLNQDKDKREFGKVLNRYLGMIRGGYIWQLSKESKNNARQCYRLSQLSQLSQFYPSSVSKENNSSKSIGHNPDTVETVETQRLTEIAYIKGDLAHIRSPH